MTKSIWNTVLVTSIITVLLLRSVKGKHSSMLYNQENIQGGMFYNGKILI